VRCGQLGMIEEAVVTLLKEYWLETDYHRPRFFS
jgi:hypothetical protein